jgi:probable F420-dependent oxidoreductase
MDYWLYLNDSDEGQLVEIARCAEATGFRGVAIADHVAVPVAFDTTAHPSGHAPFDHRTSFPDPLITASAILASTRQLLVMSYVYVLPMREPFSVAKQVATLAVLSGGRFRLGVGAGWLLEEIALLGHRVPGRGRRMDEMLEILRAFWTRESIEFHGEFFDFAPAGMAPRPREPVPIWVGGKSRAARERAARHGGWLGMNYPLREVHRLLDALRDIRKRTGEREPFETFVIPMAAASAGLYADLESRGVTGTMAFAWPGGDPAFASLGAKRDAIARFADAFIGR